MKKFALLVLLSLFLQAVPPVFAQKIRGEGSLRRGSKEVETSPIPARETPKPSERVPVDFGKIESYSDENGAYLRWSMDSEPADNVGFIVYRVNRLGARAASDILPGAIFKSGERYDPLAQYQFYDRAGTTGTAYYLEAVALDNGRVRSETIGTRYTGSIDDVAGGDELKAAKMSAEADKVQVEQNLQTYTELADEIRSYELDPDPAAHYAVISQPGVRIGVKNDGLIRVQRADLLVNGFDTAGDTTNWQLYLEGNQIPMLIDGTGDHIEFFGKGTNTLEADTRVYYLINGSEPGKRIGSQVLRKGLTTLGARNYNQTFRLARNDYYLPEVLNGPEENFWGNPVGAAGTNIVFELKGVDKTPGTRPLSVTIQGFSLGSHNHSVTLNGTQIGTLSGTNRQSMNGNFNVDVNLLLEGQNVLRLQSTNGLLGLFDNFEIEFPRKFVAQNGRLHFYTENYRNVPVSGFATPNVRLFDVTDENDPKLFSNVQVVQTGDTYGPFIPAWRGRVYTAVEDAGLFAPAFVQSNDTGILADPTTAATLVIITHRTLLAQAGAWAQYRSSQGVSTKIVDTQEIFDEFSYGTHSTHAIRQFLEWAKDNWATPPGYVLLIGDASVDHRNYMGMPFYNHVPTQIVDTLYEETGSDDALADFNNDGLADLPIGRIASRTTGGIENALAKTIAWEASITPNILDRGALFAHDYFDQYDFQAMSGRIMATLPVAMPKTTVQSNDANGGTVVLNAFNEIDAVNPQNSGVYVANYAGHGNVSAWRNDNFFGKPRIPQLTNAGRPTLVTALTCLNGYFVGYETGAESLAEGLLTAQDKGAVAVWASTGKTTPDVQEVMAKRFFLKIAEGNTTRLGDLVNDAKAQVQAGLDVRRSWALFGDPMLKVR